MDEWIVNTIQSLGYWGIGLLMFLENLFPPIPSELIMPLAGFTVSRGEMNFLPVVGAGVLGTVLGAFPWYYAGRILGNRRLHVMADRYGKWIGISARDIDKANLWFKKRGNQAVFLGRLVPGVRTLISIPAGLSYMLILPFIIYSTVGTILWVTLLTGAGYILAEKYELVEVYLGPVSKVVLAILVVSFLIWLVRRQLRGKI